MLQCPAFAGPAGPAFFFFCLSQLLSAASLRWRQNHFSLTWGWPLPPDSFTTAPHGSNEAGLGLRWCRFPYPVPKTAHRAAQGLFSLLRSLLHFSPTGKSWADLEPVLLWVAWIRPQAAHTGPTGLVWGFASAVPLPGPQNRTQALTGASWGYLFFLGCFCSGSSAKSFSSL